MLVTFHTKAYADITMFGDVAVALLKMMGLSGAVPSAIHPEDIPEALQRLQAAVAKHETERSATQTSDQDEEGETPVTLSHRAMPLIELLQAALADHRDVMWDKG